MKTQNSLLYSLLVFPILLWSQGPGYMGKKTVFGYGAHMNPVTFGSTADNKTLLGNAKGSSETGYIRINLTHEFFLERALSKSILMGVSLKYLRTGYDNRLTLNSNSDKPSDYYVINAYTYTAYLKTYTRKYIAPWGRYFIIGPSISVMSSKHDEYMNILQTVNNHDTLITNFGSDFESHYSADLLIGTGMSRVLFNRLVLDYGFHFQLFALISAVEPLLPFSTDAYPKQDEYINETIRSRVRAANRFNVFIKLGYLF
ncbi:hypothetical protein [Aurantibacillus circumpalustris]|uniref:hypothetical protein n=1 Tax=Aurantibacillus circumpalustris TaxID=3036359 RepID=UPI00295C38C0|nr:hypothetical protein [Aurantibacillus circumpalustris]